MYNSTMLAKILIPISKDDSIPNFKSSLSFSLNEYASSTYCTIFSLKNVTLLNIFQCFRKLRLMEHKKAKSISCHHSGQPCHHHNRIKKTFSTHHIILYFVHVLNSFLRQLYKFLITTAYSCQKKAIICNYFLFTRISLSFTL